MSSTAPAGQIIFLHGASSSGKSTLARAFQAQVDLPFWHVSFDHLRDSGTLPMARFSSGDFRWRDVRENVFGGFHRSLATYASAGNNLIVEHIIDTEGWLAQLLEILAPIDVFFVAVHCPLETLIAREIARGDRQAGSAAQDFAMIHRGLIYDLELDGTASVSANVATVLHAWRNRPPPSAFETMRKS
ncbi:COG3896 Chloramphenicol 3-O-phosphotransferase [Rhabdaerophilaceae bacterium]